ncbi:hypothetical protein LWI28_013247 [Acer negundo]|uniref:GAG-pre-integrase domain-containing protein n=1 Tax=Acer negundo TaxID=4023 RepID=A0AAD5IEN7_ACENE|nr:hypothetical protein LWI28_013247 [Acer negundo]
MEYVMSFLMGLHDSFTQVRGQLFLMDPIPPINKVFAFVSQEEKQRAIGVHSMNSGTANAISMAFAVRNDAMKFNTNLSSNKTQKKKRPICTQCGYPGHTIEKCYKLHGYPPGYKPKQEILLLIKSWLLFLLKLPLIRFLLMSLNRFLSKGILDINSMRMIGKGKKLNGLYVLDANLPLASVSSPESWVLDSSGYKVTMEGGVLKVVRGAFLAMKGTRQRNLYFLDGYTVTGRAAVSSSSDNEASDTSRLWHMRLGHVGEKALQGLVKQGLLKGAKTVDGSDDQDEISVEVEDSAPLSEIRQQPESIATSRLKRDIRKPARYTDMVEYALPVTDDLVLPVSPSDISDIQPQPEPIQPVPISFDLVPQRRSSRVSKTPYLRDYHCNLLSNKVSNTPIPSTLSY